MYEATPSRDAAPALALGIQHWPEVAAYQESAYDAETCRLVSLAAATIGGFDEQWMWGTQALHRFARLGRGAGVASPRLVRRWYWEDRALLESVLGRHTNASTSYATAARFALGGSSSSSM